MYHAHAIISRPNEPFKAKMLVCILRGVSEQNGLVYSSIVLHLCVCRAFDCFLGVMKVLKLRGCMKRAGLETAYLGDDGVLVLATKTPLAGHSGKPAKTPTSMVPQKSPPCPYRTTLQTSALKKLLQ